MLREREAKKKKRLNAERDAKKERAAAEESRIQAEKWSLLAKKPKLRRGPFS